MSSSHPIWNFQRKQLCNWSGREIRETSTDFLDLSAGAGLVVSGISTGTVLVRQAVEKWALGQPKMASVQATHYPDISQASPTLQDHVSEPAFEGKSLCHLGQVNHLTLEFPAKMKRPQPMAGFIFGGLPTQGSCLRRPFTRRS